jgi:hypothetical protein
MLHQEAMYQLRQQRNRALMMEAQQARIKQELLRSQGMHGGSTSRMTRLQLVLRYARYVLTTLATVGFGITLN